ncbi:MAG: indole-3-glycerol phosphate synthase TrpC, partial [Armatimonadetes bacterium]|nr:indole-3-glycerol phosphate synthase TrpC [Armatimonadota bacterium]
MKLSGILEEIVESKRRELQFAKADRPVELLRDQAAELAPVRDFAETLRGTEVALIAEIKRASPSEGEFPVLWFDPRQIAQDYVAGGALAISVLTEENYFKGAPNFIARARGRIPLPILRKDFILEDYQVYESRALQADAVLLIAAILEPEILAQLHQLVGQLGMTALVEVHNEEELEQALTVGAQVIGINNRDLATMEVDLSTTERLAPLAREDALVVSESGINCREDVERVAAAGVDAVLVGTALMKSGEFDLAAR